MKSGLIKKVILTVLFTGLIAGMFFSAANAFRVTGLIDKNIHELVHPISVIIERIDAAYMSEGRKAVDYYTEILRELKSKKVVREPFDSITLKEAAAQTGAVDILIVDNQNKIRSSAFSGSGGAVGGSLDFSTRGAKYSGSDIDVYFQEDISYLFGMFFSYYLEESGLFAVFIFMPDSYIRSKYPDEISSVFEYRTIMDVVEKNRKIFFADLYNITGAKNWSLVYPGKPFVPSEKYDPVNSGERKVVKKWEGKAIHYYIKILPSYGIESRNSNNSGEMFRVLEITADSSIVTGMATLNSLLFIVFMVLFLIFYFSYFNPYLQSYIFNRMDVIRLMLDEMKKTGAACRIYVGGNDELTELSEKINTVFSILEKKNSSYREKYDEILDFAQNLPFGILSINSNRYISYRNRFAHALYDDESGTVYGFFNTVLGRRDSSDAIKGVLEVAEGKSHIFKRRYRFRKGGGRNKLFDIVACPVSGMQNICLVLIFDSGTEYKAFSTSRLPGNSALGSIAGIIANDLNNIFQIINGYCEYLLSENRSTEDVKSTLEKIMETGNKADIFTRNLQMFGSGRKINMPEKIDINKLLSALNNIIQSIAGRGVEVIYRPGETRMFSGDVGLIAQVIISMCLNASEAMPEGGILEIETGIREYTDEDARLFPESRKGFFVYCSIKDTGTGIEEEDMPYIFEPFFTTRTSDTGRGFGLAVSYSIIAEHKGFVSVFSEKNKGSVFTINFPITDSAEEVSGSIKEHGSDLLLLSDINRIDILLVDDEEMILSLGRAILEKEGYRVITASSGAEALEKFRIYIDTLGLIVADIVMPDVSGREIVEKIRSVKPFLPVLYISGFNEGITGLGSKDKVLKKPFRGAELVSAVKKLTEIRQ